jgi:phospholipid-binding lipoprotein MlaA
MLAVLLPLLAACATPPPPSEPEARAAYESASDPFEPTNYQLYDISTAVDNAALKPIAKTYGNIVPAPLRMHVSDFFANLEAPGEFVNFVLETKSSLAGTALMRFLVNSTLGLGGMFDVASRFGYCRRTTDFGLTLGLWGVPPGPYLFVPFVGPSDFRDALSTTGEIVSGGLTFIPGDAAVLATTYSVSALGSVDSRQRALRVTDEIERTALDRYATTRSLYQQRRQSDLAALRRNDEATVPVWFASPPHRRTCPDD